MRFLRDHFPAPYGKAAAFIFLVALVASAPAHGAKADRKGQSPIARDSASRKYVSPKDLHSLIDQEGLPFSFTGLAKKTVLLNFIFTSCEAICPRQTQALVEIQRALPPALRQRVHFVSVTVDPDRDSAPTLKIYALAMGADLSDWSFVTGKTPELLAATVLRRQGYRPEQGPSQPSGGGLLARRPGPLDAKVQRGFR